MPSRKRAKGKARKAKARESNCNLILHNDSICRHGCEVISKDDICYKLVEQLEVEMNTVIDSMPDELQLFNFYNATNERLRSARNMTSFGMMIVTRLDSSFNLSWLI